MVHLRLNRRYHETLEGPATPGARPSGLKLLPEKDTHLREFSITHNKIAPIYRCPRELVARPPRIRKTKPPFVEMWVGVSAKERDKRCKPSHEPWITNRWPLRELGMSRQDRERWLLERYGRVVFKVRMRGLPYVE
jgi:hypothetical protein